MKNHDAVPNIILLILDTVRADRLSCYDHKYQTSPFLDTSSKEGVLYLNCFAPANWSVPSHASVFTGLYPSSHQTNFRNLRLTNEIPTIAEILNQNGYDTCAITSNAWISSVTDLHRGFRHYFGMWPTSKRAKSRQIALWTKLALETLAGVRDKGGRRTLDTLFHWLSNRDKSLPFFLFINLMEAHAPYSVPRGFPGTEFYKRQRVPRRLKKRHLGLDYLVDNSTLSKKDLELLSNLYNGGIRYLDYLTSKLVAQLQKLQLFDDTMLIITSDHGESLGDQGILGHQFKLTSDLLHVPLMIKMPNNQFAAERISTPVQLIDLFPTILEVANISSREKQIITEGQSILPNQMSDFHREFILAEDIGPEIRSLKRRYGYHQALQWDIDQWMLSNGDWTITHRNDGKSFVRGKIPNDELERANKVLSSRMELTYQNDQFSQGGYGRHTSNDILGTPDVPPDVLERLRSLGYLE